MPKISSWMPRAFAASLTVLSVFASQALTSAAWAQQPPPVRIRGTIESVDGPMLMIKSREGTDMKVRMTDNVAVFGVAKTELSEIKPGSYIGVSAMPEPDGTQKALAVHIFPESQRGAAEGFRPWDLRAGSTMTNATVAETVGGTDGQNILVRYKDGEKKVVVPPGTPVVTFVAGDKSEVKPGAKIIIFGAVKKDDGVLEANRVNIGRARLPPALGGVGPPPPAGGLGGGGGSHKRGLPVWTPTPDPRNGNYMLEKQMPKIASSANTSSGMNLRLRSVAGSHVNTARTSGSILPRWVYSRAYEGWLTTCSLRSPAT